MISRRTLLTAAVALPAAARRPLRPKVGINIYSLRYMAQKDLPATSQSSASSVFKRWKPVIFTDVGLLNAAGLQATSFAAGYDELGKNLNTVMAAAKTLGVSYVVCTTIPHSGKHLAPRDCAPAAANLNRWGERLAAFGLRLCYHSHGTEFDSSTDGTVSDTFAKLTNPKYANFEMDIFWIYGRQDPVRLLHRYPGRFPLMHIKDI